MKCFQKREHIVFIKTKRDLKNCDGKEGRLKILVLIKEIKYSIDITSTFERQTNNIC